MYRHSCAAHTVSIVAPFVGGFCCGVWGQCGAVKLLPSDGVAEDGFGTAA